MWWLRDRWWLTVVGLLIVSAGVGLATTHSAAWALIAVPGGALALWAER